MFGFVVIVMRNVIPGFSAALDRNGNIPKMGRDGRFKMVWVSHYPALQGGGTVHNN
jgi:hypothetical protein